MPMPKNRMKKVIYFEHDDRIPMATESTRRVSFKNYNRHGNHKNVRQRARDDKMRVALMQDEDVEMMVGSTSYGNRGSLMTSYSPMYPRMGRKGRGGRQDNVYGDRRLTESPVHWYKVLIPQGHKYESEYLMGLLSSYIKPLDLTPYGIKKLSDCLQFHVDDYKVATQLLLADRRITTSDNWRLVIIVRANIPQVDVDARLRALMKLAMSSRYNLMNNSLDLSKFHTDPVMIKENAFSPLNRASVLTAILQIIGDSIPDLRALNLSHNHLVGVDALKSLKLKTPNLKLLHLGNNHIRFMNQFDSLQGLQITELELDGNPLCNKFRDKETYIRDVQKVFPKVIKLDGAEVPRCITFSVEEEIPLVASQGSFLCDQAARAVILPFLQQYYTLYDSEARAPLVDAYHQDAQFSLSCTHQNSASSYLVPYLQDSRNLLIVNSGDKRKKLLRRGKNEIVEFITSLPRTQHDPTSLIVDCSVFTPAIIVFSVTGVFREVTEKKCPMKSFHRAFILVPVGTGFCITNDMLHISLATSDQVKSAFPSPEVPAAAPVVAPPGEVDIATKQQMVTALSSETGMNLTWSEKCLVENTWDFNRAVFVCIELQKEKKIPPEAFIK